MTDNKTWDEKRISRLCADLEAKDAETERLERRIEATGKTPTEAAVDCERLRTALHTRDADYKRLKAELEAKGVEIANVAAARNGAQADLISKTEVLKLANTSRRKLEAAIESKDKEIERLRMRLAGNRVEAALKAALGSRR